MKLLIPLLTFFIITTSFHVEKSNSGLMLQVKLGNWQKELTGNTMTIVAKLVNPTSDPIKYTSWYCGWENLYKTDINEINVLYHGCDKNYPILVKIPPHSSQEKVLSLISEESIQKLKKYRFCLGFCFHTIDHDLLTQLLPCGNPATENIWSDTLNLSHP